MYQINFNKPVKIRLYGHWRHQHQRPAPEILHAKGFTVVGSDAHESAITDHLTSLGIQIADGQRAENITPDTDVAVCTAAIHPDNPEFAAAKSGGFPDDAPGYRAELLGDHDELYQCHRRFRYPRQDNDNFHAVSDSLAADILS